MEIEDRKDMNDIELAPDRKYVRKDSFILRKIAGSNVLISVGENVANFNGYIQLNDTAAFLWESLEEPKTAEELADDLLDEFEVSPDEAREDTDRFLKDLIKENMIRSE